MKEWKEHPEYNRYLVSTEGEVKDKVTGNICNVFYPKGRATVTIVVNGTRCKKSLAHIVAVTFIPNPEGLVRVKHINGNRRDNRAENLKWFGKKEATGTKAKPIQKKEKENNKKFSVLNIPNSSIKSYAKKKEYITYRGKRYLVTRPTSNLNYNNVLTIEKQLASIKMLKEGKTIEEVADAVKVRCKQLCLWVEKTLDSDNNYSILESNGEEYKRYLKEHSKKGRAV